ncbi:MAG TPA: DUF6265 family protein [Gemmatimonadaceae bacterium]
MRPTHLAALLLLAMPLVAVDARAQRADSIASLQWLTGCLEARSATRVVEEQRMAPSAGTMLGMGRTTNARGLADYELTLIRQDGARLLYEAHPNGQPSATFVARVANEDSVVFELPEHDFPQRVAYRRAGRDSVLAWVEGTIRGATRRFEFPYRRVPCPGAPSP